MEKDYLEMMIADLNKNLIEVTSFGDETSRKAIEVQIAMYQKELNKISA